MGNFLDREPNDETESSLEVLERHGYAKITALLDAGEYEEANQVLDVLARCGIV